MQLITINSSTIGGEVKDTVNARDLHEFLEVGRDFSNWIKDQIDRARLVAGRDFVTFTEKGERAIKIEYALTIEAGKSIGMMSATDKGFEIRDYFLECERKVHNLQVSYAVPTMIAPAKEFKAAFSICRMIGLDKNQSALSANKATIRLTGMNVLNVIGHDSLVAEKQELIFTPTELGKRIGISGIKFNKLLEAAGFQASIDKVWIPTDTGKPFATVLDTDKRHNSGAPIQQVKWCESVVDRLAA